MFLDTGLHFRETYETIDAVLKTVSEAELEELSEQSVVEQQEEVHGERLWERNPDHCCHLLHYLLYSCPVRLPGFLV